MAERMRALTVHQPWAAAIVDGRKRVENRPWHTAHRGPLLLHTSLRWSIDGEKSAAVRETLGLPATGHLHEADYPWLRQQVVAVVDIVGCHVAADGCCAPWGEPSTDQARIWHWQIGTVWPINAPWHESGRQKLWMSVPPMPLLLADESLRTCVSCGWLYADALPLHDGRRTCSRVPCVFPAARANPMCACGHSRDGHLATWGPCGMAVVAPAGGPPCQCEHFTDATDAREGGDRG